MEPIDPNELVLGKDYYIEYKPLDRIQLVKDTIKVNVIITI
jgi:hypothetical protein